MLDPDEYFHLALHANSLKDHHACMEYLREVLLRQPENAPALYLLAVQHAELGLFERAVTGMKAALAIDPRLETARFQLGLLLLDGNRRAEAKEHFRVLEGSPDPALRTYSEAMTALAEDNSRAAQEKLVLGLAQQSRNPALSIAMQRVLDMLSRKSSEGAPSEPEARDTPGFLGAYRQLP